jgi:diaminopimelate epimerase
LPELPFAKGHGLGNDYLVVEAADLPWPLTPARIRAFCDRNRGAGGDGILVGRLEERRFHLRIFNPDGSEAEKSGNGLRIFGAYLHGRGHVRAGEEFAVALAKDEVRMTVHGAGADWALDITVDVGHASFRGEDVGFVPEPGEVLGRRLALPGGAAAEVHTVSLANPHCVVFVDARARPA